MWKRRSWSVIPRLATAWLASAGLLSCTSTGGPGGTSLSARPPGPERLLAPQGEGGATAGVSGLQPLDIGAPREGALYVPSGYQPDRPAPLVVMLHGAGGDPAGGMDPFVRLADDHGLILVAPASTRQTWDAVGGSFGPDVRSIDRALQQIFARYRVDRSRLAVEGFSDGASYALSLGLANGDLFTHVIAFSPGFVAPGSRQGKPQLFISHGRHDAVLPIDRTSRRIAPDLEERGYHVTYREFDGPHTVPADMAEEAVWWFTGTPA